MTEDGSDDDSVPGLTVAAVARQMGVAPATLRTWDRRYGVGPSAHIAGAHRRYSVADVARLERMRKLVIAGYPPSDAARASDQAPVTLASVVTLPGAPATAGTETPRTEAAGRSGGGRVVPLPGATSGARGLARAARSLDTAGCSAILTQSLEARGVVWTWEQLVVPVLVGLGRHWQSTGEGIDVEHALSGAVQDALSGAIRALPPPTNSGSVLLACAPGEMHSLALYALAAALAERRVGARVLGASLPVNALADAVRRLGPAVVFLWSQLPGTADSTLIASIPTMRPAATILVGGPGWPADLPADVTRTVDLTDTVARIAHAAGE